MKDIFPKYIINNKIIIDYYDKETEKITGNDTNILTAATNEFNFKNLTSNYNYYFPENKFEKDIKYIFTSKRKKLFDFF